MEAIFIALCSQLHGLWDGMLHHTSIQALEHLKLLYSGASSEAGSRGHCLAVSTTASATGPGASPSPSFMLPNAMAGKDSFWLADKQHASYLSAQ